MLRILVGTHVLSQCEWGDFIRLAHAEPIHVWQFMTWPLVI